MTTVTQFSASASPCRKAHSYTVGECLACRIAELELALNQIINGCVDDGDEGNAYWKLSPGEIRKLARSALGKGPAP